MYLALRIIRGIFGLIFGMQVIGLLPILSLLTNPSEMSGELLAVVTVKLIALVISGAIFFYGRTGINALHKILKGEPHPSLAKKWSL
ncbi:MAG: hypothetical protein KZQ94_09830 [Candidatus Thiodiazotropha sp. (ex Troendleina suluensis)]|nr:hypothetical protein [Candidatus Thiodiazotropha sp. (ex Troendleina suluensis)]